MKQEPRVGQRNWQYANGPLMINALLLLYSLLLAITMRPAAGITVPLPLELALQQQQQQQQQLHHHDHHLDYHPHSQHTRSNYYEPASETGAALESASEALAGLAGYTQHYYGTNSAAGTRQTLQDDADDGDIGDLAAAPYANYEPQAVTANGFMPTTALHGYNNNNNNNNNNRLHSEVYDVVGGQRGKIDFVINTANYELDGNEEQPRGIYYQSYGYQPHAKPQAPLAPPAPLAPLAPLSPPLTPLAPLSVPLLDYPIEQFSNYRHVVGGLREPERVAPQPRQLNDVNGMVYGNSLQHAPVGHEQHQRRQRQHSEPQSQLRDQQISARHIADLPGSESVSGSSSGNSLPPITTSVHHNPSSSKALAGLPLAKHIEVTKNVPIPHYQKQYVPYKQSVPLRVARPVITTIPKPIPIRIPVPKTVAVPQLQEVKIPVEKVKPVAVERPIPFVVERRVPYRVEKPIATPIYYPYPVKVPIVRTVVHKQRPGPVHHWAPLNHLSG